MNEEERGKVFMKSNSPEPLVVDKEGNIYYSAKVINELENKEKQKLEQEIEILNENNQAMQEEMARTWKKLDEKENIIKEVREKVDNFDVFKEFTFPLMKRDEEQQVKSSIDYEWRKSIKEPILEILDKENK